MSMMELTVENLSFQYNRSPELNLEEINLQVSKGEVIGVLGVTGAGKTTFMRALNGLIPQFFEGKISGKVLVQDLDTQVYRIQSLVRRVGFVFDDPETQIFGVNVKEDVAFGPCNFGLPKEEVMARIKKSLNLVGLEGYEERATENLSGGEKQRLAIAGVLAMGSEILVLDEPTAALDPLGKEAVFQIVELLKKQGMTVLLVEHETEDMAARVERVIILDHGRIVHQGETRDVFQEVPLFSKYHLRPPEVAEFGWCLYEERLISKDEVPVTEEEGVALIKRLLPMASPSTDNAVKVDKSEGKGKILQSGNAAQQEVIIEVKDLSFSYIKKQPVLKGINLQIHQGDFLALVGQNGAGKTTFCKILTKLLAADKGKVTFKGEEINKFSHVQLAKHLGYVFQNPDHQIFSSSIKEELEFGLINQGLDEAERNERIKKVLNIVKLDKPLTTHPLNLGRGERQRLAVASILVLELEALIIDEPTTGQDWQGTLNIMDLIKDLNRQGHTILIITHDMRLVAEYCNRVVVLNKGAILADETPRQLFTKPDLLKEARLRPPQISRMAHQLAEQGVPRDIIDVEELLAAVKSLKNRRGV
jgi:energy-coupling factor transport system ATP-binding protein